MKARRPTHALTMQVDHARRHGRTMVIAQRYESGTPVIEIADEFQCSVKTVLRIARLMGLEKRPKAADPERKGRIIEQYKRGDPVEVIAEANNCSPAWVCRVAADAKILRRKFKEKEK